jgi:polysaccharide pyruvyl transferase WcaK-like protein
VAVHGSFNTLNVGDRAIGLAVDEGIRERLNVRPQLYGKHHDRFSGYRMVVVAGGSVIHDHLPGHLDRLVSVVESVPKVVFVGAGVPGFITEEGRATVRELLQRGRVSIVVRDRLSRERMEAQLGITPVEAADAAFLLDGRLGEPVAAVPGVVGISARDLFTNPKLFAGYGTEEAERSRQRECYVEYLRDLVVHLRGDSRTPIYFPFAAEDIAFARHAFRGVAVEIAPLYSRPLDLLRAVGRTEFMVCSRYHSLVFSILTGRRVLVLSYGAKVEALATEIAGVEVLRAYALPARFEPPRFADVDAVLSARRRLVERSRINLDVIEQVYRGLR